jgi:hypothetical protein
LGTAISSIIANSISTGSSDPRSAVNLIVSNAVAKESAEASNALTTLSNQISPTNTTFISNLASNPVFINAIITQILNNSNNYGIVVRQNQSLTFPVIAPIIYSNNARVPLAAISSSGLALDYSSAHTSVATIVSNNTLLIMGAGSTTITASQAGNPLYYPVSATRTLTVNPINQTISFPSIAPQTRSKTSVLTLSAASSARLPVTYIVANTAIATNRTSNSLTLIGTGTTTVTATNAGSQNYTPGGAIQTLIVK